MRGDAKLLRGLGDHLCSLVVHPQRGVIVLIDEHLKCLEQTENSLLADLAATADAIFLRHTRSMYPTECCSSMPIKADSPWAPPVCCRCLPLPSATRGPSSSMSSLTLVGSN